MIRAQTADGPYEKQVYALARAAEAEMIPQSEPLYEKMVDAHNADVEGYSLEARRWGDFLALFIQRGGDKYVGSINLAQTAEFRLAEGHRPDKKGKLTYYVRFKKDGAEDEGSMSIGSDALGSYYFNPNEVPPKGYHYSVVARLPSMSTRRQMISLSTQDHGILVGSGGDIVRLGGNYGGIETPGMARAAEDDQIIFNTGIILYVPAGRGTAIRDTLLAEIAKGYKPAQLNLERK